MIPQVLFNTNLFVDGINFKGDVPSLSLPKLVDYHRLQAGYFRLVQDDGV